MDDCPLNLTESKRIDRLALRHETLSSMIDMASDTPQPNYFMYHLYSAQKLGFPVTERFPACTGITERVPVRPAVARILAKEAALN